MAIKMNLIPDQDYVDICGAVRNRTKTTDLIRSGELADKISSIRRSDEVITQVDGDDASKVPSQKKVSDDLDAAKRNKDTLDARVDNLEEDSFLEVDASGEKNWIEVPENARVCKVNRIEGKTVKCKNLLNISSLSTYDSNTTVQNNNIVIDYTNLPGSTSHNPKFGGFRGTLREALPGVKEGDTVYLSFSSDISNPNKNKEILSIFLLPAKEYWYQNVPKVMTKEILDSDWLFYGRE